MLKKSLLASVCLLVTALLPSLSFAFGVSIEQAATQTDPTRNSLVLYTATFANAIDTTSFDCSDVTVSGTASAFCFIVSEAGPLDGTTFQIAINGLLDGTIIPSVDAGLVLELAGPLTNDASTSVDASVTLDTTAPESAASLSSPSTVGNNLSAPLIGRCGLDAAGGTVTIETAPIGGFLPAAIGVALDGAGGFNIPVTWQEGEFLPTISCYDALGNGPTITSTVSLPPVELDVTRPTVSINQSGDDPTGESEIKFTLVISEAVEAPVCADFDFSLSTVTTVSCNSIVSVPNLLGLAIFELSVTASGSGLVVASIPENSFADPAGNLNFPSTSTDNEVTYIEISPALTINPSDGAVLSGTQVDLVDITLADSNGDAICTAVIVAADWSCSSAPGNLPGDGETITATGVSVLSTTAVETLEVNALLTNPDKDKDGIPDRIELYADTDNDGLDDYYDIDSDNDKVPDVIEAGDFNDTNGNGISDRFDVTNTDKYDPNGDGIDDAALFDRDNDGVADFRDADADDDGLPDFFEAGISAEDTDMDGIDNSFDTGITSGPDVNSDGIDDSYQARNTDNRKLPDFLTPDSDDDGINDALESRLMLSFTDADNDNIDDAIDADVNDDGFTDAGKTDANADGVDDAINVDTDLDGVFDRYDLDSDNDSLLDTEEAVVSDLNKDGFIDNENDRVATPVDSDLDGAPDYRDVDKYGVLDIAGTAFASLDVDGDGRVELVAETDADGILGSVDLAPTVYGNKGGAVIIAVPGVDSDGDLIPDVAEIRLNQADIYFPWINADSDGDGIGDLHESGLQAAYSDADADGIDDAFDADADGDGNTDAGKQDADFDQVIDRLSLAIRDTDGDGIADMLDLDSDGDGISDKDEGTADYDNDGVEDYIDLDKPIEVAKKGGGSIGLLSLAGLLLLFRLKKLSVALLLLLPWQLHASEWLDNCTEVYEASVFFGQAKLSPESSGVFAQTENTSSAYKAQLACKLSQNVNAEAFYSQLGSADFAHLNPSLNLKKSIDYSVLGISARYRWRVFSERHGIYARLGLAKVLADDGGLRVDKDSAPQIMLGLGTDWQISPRWGVELAYDRYTDDASLLMLGLTYQLGKPKDLQHQPRKTAYQRPIPEAPVAETVKGKSVQLDLSMLPEIEVLFDEALVDEKKEIKPLEEMLAVAPSLAEIRDILMEPLPEELVLADSCEKYKVSGMSPSLSVGFAVDSAGLTYEVMENLQHFAGCLSYHLDGALIIEGHSDETATSQYNLRLSAKRAAAVKKYLLNLGLKTKRINEVGMGEEHLKRKDTTQLGHAYNRRVELYIR